MSEPSRCPWCGANHVYFNPHTTYAVWECRSEKFDNEPKPRQSDACRISQLTQRNAKLEAVVKAARQLRDNFDATNKYILGIRSVAKALNALDKEPDDE